MRNVHTLTSDKFAWNSSQRLVIEDLVETSEKEKFPKRRCYHATNKLRQPADRKHMNFYAHIVQQLMTISDS